MCEYLDRLDIFYNIVRYLDGSDILSLLSCLPDLSKNCKFLRIHQCVDLRAQCCLRKALKLPPIFTNIYLTDLFYTNRFDKWSRDLYKVAENVKTLKICGASMNIDLNHLKKLTTLKVMNPMNVDFLYKIEKLDSLELNNIPDIKQNMIRYMGMPFIRDICHLKLVDSPVNDLSDMIPYMENLKSFCYVKYLPHSSCYSEQLLQKVMRHCDKLETLTIRMNMEFFSERLLVNLPSLERLNLTVILGWNKNPGENARYYCRQISKVFGRQNCPCLKSLRINFMIATNMYLKAIDTLPTSQSLLVCLVEEFGHLETLELYNVYSRPLLKNFEKHNTTSIHNRIKTVHIMCPVGDRRYENFIGYRIGQINMYTYCGCNQHDSLMEKMLMIFPQLENLYVKKSKKYFLFSDE